MRPARLAPYDPRALRRSTSGDINMNQPDSGITGIRLIVWRRGWDSNPCDVAVKLISSLFCNCDGGACFGVVSVSPVPVESRLKSGFFRSESLAGQAFLKVGSNRHFFRFGEKCGKIGEKNRETAIHRRIELPTDENLFLRCYKWMYSPLTGTAFPR